VTLAASIFTVTPYRKQIKTARLLPYDARAVIVGLERSCKGTTDFALGCSLSGQVSRAAPPFLVLLLPSRLGQSRGSGS